MPRYRDDEDDRGYRSRGGPPRDEYGQFMSRDDRGGGRPSPRYEDDDDRYEGRREGGYRSSHMQDRDEYGQFTGYGGGSRGESRSESRGDSSGGGGRPSSRYDEDDRRHMGGGRSGYGRPSREYDDEPFGGYEGRREGGMRSSHMQDRDEYGQFTGYGGSSRGRSSSRFEEDDERGGGRYRSRGGSSRHEDDDDYRGSSMRGQSRGRGGDYVDSAGRHYSRESWERAQEGRALGGQHSHGGR